MRSRRGVSLVEVLVVVGVLGLLVGLALPAVQRARGAAQRAACLDRARQLGLALHAYHAATGHFPPAPAGPADRAPVSRLSWMAALLPYVERDDLHRAAARALALDANPEHAPPHTPFVTPVAAFACPADGRLASPLTNEHGVTAAFGTYLGLAGAMDAKGGQFRPGVLTGCRIADVTDGTSQTVAVGERPPPDSLRAGWWYPSAIGATHGGPGGPRGPDGMIHLGVFLAATYDPGCQASSGGFGPGRLDNPCDRFHLWSLHSGGGNFLFADGSAKFLPHSVGGTLDALATRAGGEALGVPE